MFALEIFRSRMSSLLEMVEMEAYFFMILYFALIFENFKYAEMIYHFIIEDFLKTNDMKITEIRRAISDWYYNNISFIWHYFKRTLAGIFAVLSRFLPARFQPFVEGFRNKASMYAAGQVT